MPNDKKVGPIAEQPEFEFIQEQIIPKKTWKMVLGSIVKTILLAILFGIVCSIVICVAYPYVKNKINKDEDGRLTAMTKYMSTIRIAPIIPECKAEQVKEKETNTTVIEKIVDFTLEDYNSLYKEVDDLVRELNHSIVTVNGIMSVVDVFQNPSETTNDTAGLIIKNSKETNKISILTRYAKIKNANKLQVTFNTDNVVDAKITSFDSKLDIAVISVDRDAISDSVRGTLSVAILGETVTSFTGDPIIALGNPNGYLYSREYGIITGRTTNAYITDNKIDLFNTDITDNDNGDGFIFNLRGEVIGIITHKFKSDLNANINTAVSVTRIKPIINDLVEKRNRTYLGVVGTDVTAEISKKLDVSRGVYVNEVETDSPALLAGIQTGDVIIDIDNIKITSMGQLNTVISSYQPKDELKIKVVRTAVPKDEEQKEMVFTVQLHKKKK